MAIKENERHISVLCGTSKPGDGALEGAFFEVFAEYDLEAEFRERVPHFARIRIDW